MFEYRSRTQMTAGVSLADRNCLGISLGRKVYAMIKYWLAQGQLSGSEKVLVWVRASSTQVVCELPTRHGHRSSQGLAVDRPVPPMSVQRSRHSLDTSLKPMGFSAFKISFSDLYSEILEKTGKWPKTADGMPFEILQDLIKMQWGEALDCFLENEPSIVDFKTSGGSVAHSNEDFWAKLIISEDPFLRLHGQRFQAQAKARKYEHLANCVKSVEERNHHLTKAKKMLKHADALLEEISARRLAKGLDAMRIS